MITLWVAYLAFAGGLMGFGGIFIWVGLRGGTAGLARPWLRIATALSLLVAVAGLVAAVVLENRAANPW